MMEVVSVRQINNSKQIALLDTSSISFMQGAEVRKDYVQKPIITMIKSGEGPDLFPIPVGMTLDTALSENWFQPLNPYVTEEFSSSLIPCPLEKESLMQEMTGIRLRS